jgi:hypothetical protein
VLEVAWELFPFGVGRGAVFLAGPELPSAGDERPVTADCFLGVDRFVAHLGVDVVVSEYQLRDAGRHPVEDGVGGEDPASFRTQRVQSGSCCDWPWWLSNRFVPGFAGRVAIRHRVCDRGHSGLGPGWGCTRRWSGVPVGPHLCHAALVHADEPDQPGPWSAVVWASAETADGRYQIASAEDVLDVELEAWLGSADLADGLADDLGAVYLRMGVVDPRRAEDFEGNG